MKRLMYLSISILCLSLSLLIGFHFGASTARADWDGTGQILAQEGPWFLLADGTVTGLDTPGGVPTWHPDSRWVVPSNFLSQIKLWGINTFVTTSDEVYVWALGAWVSAGVPGGGTNIEPTTWGQLKGKYDK